MNPRFASNIPLHELEIGAGGEAGGLRSHVGNGSSQRWTWQAIEERSGPAFAWPGGRRTDEGCRRLLDKPAAFSLARCSAGDWTGCSRHVPSSRHVVGKPAAWKLERLNPDSGTRAERSDRKTICFSKNEKIQGNAVSSGRCSKSALSTDLTHYQNLKATSYRRITSIEKQKLHKPKLVLCKKDADCPAGFCSKPSKLNSQKNWRNGKLEHKNAIVLAMFGTTIEHALGGLLNIKSRMTARFPKTPVRIAFTSNLIRKKWQKRAADPEYARIHPEIPSDVLQVKTVLATVADLQNQGHDTIVLQPTHMAMGEEFLDLGTYVDGLMRMGTIKKKKYKPFWNIVLGRPALGTFGTLHPYSDDIASAARALAEDAKLAAAEKAALVYMGHGNEHFPSAGSYLELAAIMRRLYPDTVTLVGNVEGFPSLDDVMADLKHYGADKVLLKPCMIVAGDHAVNDMAGPEENSWKSILESNGFSVTASKSGLGELDAFADLFVSHAADAAADAGIVLK